MNLMPMAGFSGLAIPDHPWPEFDLFDSLSSPPSWVSEANTTNSSPVVMPQQEQQHLRPFDLSDVACPQVSDPFPSLHQTSASRVPMRQNHMAPDLPLPPVPSADLVDSALDFVAPTTSVLSDDLPLCAVTQSSYPLPSVTAVNEPCVQTSYHSNHIIEQAVPQGVFPMMPSLPLQPVACTSSNVDSTSQGSTSSNRPVAVSKQQAVGKVKCDGIIKPRNVKGKQTRRYSSPKSSRYCHLCARHQRCVQMIPCGNVELGLCQKSVCQKCIEAYKLEVSGPSWSCPHCLNNCPKRAKCYAYDRQTARRREKTLRAKMNTVSAAAPNASDISSRMLKS